MQGEESQEYSKNYSIYMMLFTVILLLKWVTVEYWPATRFLVSFLVIHWALEVTSRLSLDPVRYRRKKSIGMRVLLNLAVVFSFICSAIQVLYMTNYIDLMVPLYPDYSFVNIYSKSLSFSLFVFFISSGVRRFLVANNLLSIISIKRGILGIIQRLFVLAKTALLTPFWIAYFCQESQFKFDHRHIGFNTYRFYILIKFIFMIVLLWELDGCRRNYKRNVMIENKASIIDECENCGEVKHEGYLLRCGHIVCEDCYRAAYNGPFSCPICDECLIRYPSFTFPDGVVSFSALFCCF